MKKLFIFLSLNLLNACSETNTYISNVFEIDKTEETIERLIIDSEYLVATEFNKTSGAFVKTYGGYYEIVGDPMARKQGASDMFEVSERLSEVV